MAEQVVLRQNFQNEMTPADRIRYYLGLPQGYPMNPVLIEKASERLRRELGARGRLTPFEGQVMDDVFSAASAQRQDDRFEGYPGVAGSMRGHAKDVTLGVISDIDDPMHSAEWAMQRLYGALPSEHGETRDGPEVFPSQQAAAAHLQRSGFRDPGESLQQARQRLARAQVKGEPMVEFGEVPLMQTYKRNIPVADPQSQADPFFDWRSKAATRPFVNLRDAPLMQLIKRK